MAAAKIHSALDCTRDEATPLQTAFGVFCISSFIVLWLGSLMSPLLLVLTLHKEYYVTACILIAAFIASYCPWKRGAVSESIKGFYCRYHPLYYNSFKIEFEGDSLPCPRRDPQTLYAMHPHGAFCIGWSTLYCHNVLSHVRFCFSPVLLASPLFRLFSRCIGDAGSASKSAMLRDLANGRHMALPPGGFEEATLTSTSHDRVFIKKRTGFIRLCLMHGTAVRPIYVFGEKSLFSNLQGMWKFRLALNRFGIPAIVIYGNPLFPVIPKTNVDMKVVVGAPLLLPKIANPTREEVDTWHKKYIAALTKLFEDHKEDAYGPEKGKVAKLELW